MVSPKLTVDVGTNASNATNTSCIVLAGGKGTRLGRDKAMVDISGRSLLQRVVDCLSVYQNEILIVTAANRSPIELDCSSLRTTTDIYPDKGPLGGTFSGLIASNSDSRQPVQEGE